MAGIIHDAGCTAPPAECTSALSLQRRCFSEGASSEAAAEAPGCPAAGSAPLTPAGSGAVTAPACGALRRTRAHASVSVSVCLRALK